MIERRQSPEKIPAQIEKLKIGKEILIFQEGVHLEVSGLKVGRDVFLVFSPEREDPNNSKYSTEDIPKVIGGVTPTCLELAAALYARAYKTVVPVSRPRVAETSRLLENKKKARSMSNRMVWTSVHISRSSDEGHCS